jgi:hypothetical protein
MEVFIIDSRLLLLASVLLVASIFLFRRVGGLGPLLQLVGSAAYFLAHLYDVIISAGFRYGFIRPGSYLFAGCLERPIVAVPIDILRLVSLLFPIGFLWFALRGTVKRI